MTHTGSRHFTFADARRCSLADLAGELVSNVPIFRVAIRVATTRIVVAFSSQAAAALFAFRYNDLRATANDRFDREYEFFVVRKADHVYLWSRQQHAWCVPLQDPTPDVIAFFADNAMMLDYVERHRYISFHGAVLACGADAFALLGVSTAGKSTTAVACAANGMRFYSDERCLLDGGRIIPFLRALTLRPNGRRRLLIDDGFAPEYLRQRLRQADAHEDFVVPPSQLLPWVADGDAQLRAMFLISGYAERPRAEAVDMFAILPELMLSLSSRERGLDRMARAMHELQSLRHFRLTLGHPSETAQTIATVMQNG